MASTPTFDPRKLMEKAIEIMKHSVSEPRDDGKASPRVGVVLYKPDGTIETACRGELRFGDHAEYTLLERKNRSSRLDGSILFATLEPCAPESRHDPKLGCAERIFMARIKEVWIGIEDPDPTVDRKGIRYLESRGITVHMFDRDLQEIIRDENKAFIVQALERAEVAEVDKRPKEVTLSKFEEPITMTTMHDLSTEALERYRAITKIGDAIESEPFQHRLLQQGLLKEEGQILVPTGFGLLLFGREPRNVMPQAGLLGTIHYLDGREEPRDFDGPIVLIPGLVEEWLHDKLPSTIDRSRMQRRQIPALPFELIREAVVNALIHRDYEIAGAKCQLLVTEHTITVKSPGRPVPPVTLEQLQSFSAPMLSRNPQLHYVFARMELAEERGLGMKSFKYRPPELGLPLPKYAFEDPYLVLTLYRSLESTVYTLAPEVLKVLNKDERAGWEFLASKTETTKTEYAKHMGFDDRKAQRQLKHFVELGLLRRVGAGPATQYQVVQ
jgi:ATP-dependent DNA helicase RecG